MAKSKPSEFSIKCPDCSLKTGISLTGFTQGLFRLVIKDGVFSPAEELIPLPVPIKFEENESGELDSTSNLLLSYSDIEGDMRVTLFKDSSNLALYCPKCDKAFDITDSISDVFRVLVRDDAETES